MPKLSVLLCTVRGDEGAYVNHPEWHVLQKVIDDLEAQTFHDFEIVIVDGLHGRRENGRSPTGKGIVHHHSVTWVPPTPSFWTEHKTVAIARYRNTGIAHCRGELIVNLDDCCELPSHYLKLFWHAWSKHKVCLSACWPESGDQRRRGRATMMPQLLHPSMPMSTELRPQPQIFGFGSYPREIALALNGYNEWFDGAQGLEDFEWSTRLGKAGVKMALEEIKGFRIHAQSGHDPRVIDPEQSLLKCCNLAWWCSRVWQQIDVANLETPTEIQEALVGPCKLLDGKMCKHHQCSVECGYIGKGFADGRHPIAWEGVQAEAGGFDIRELRTR